MNTVYNKVDEMNIKNQSIEKLLEDAEEAEKEISKLPDIEIETKRGIIKIKQSDGITLHHSGWYIRTPEGSRFAQLFYAYSKFTGFDKNGNPIEKDEFLPFLLECFYNTDGEIIDVKIHELNDLDHIQLPDAIAKIEKKTIGIEGFPTSLPYDPVVKTIYHTKGEGISLDIKETFNKILEKVKKYVYMNEIDLKIALLWAISTYFSEVFGIVPILILIGSAGCGKTRTLKIISYIARRGFVITDPTEANLPRIIDAWKPTLCIDDLDEAMKRNKQMVLSMLKHTYKNTVSVPRLASIGRTFKLELFYPFTPVAITTTEPIEEGQLFSRCIFIHMNKSQTKLPNRDPDLYYFKDERNKLYLLSFLLAPKVEKIFDALDVPLKGRYFEIWSPILTIAKLIDENLFKEVLNKAIEETASKEEQIYKEERMVLASIEKLFKTTQTTLSGDVVVEFTAKDLLEQMRTVVVDEWQEMTAPEFERRWRTQKIGRILTRMGIEQRKTTGGKRVRTISYEKFKRLCGNYEYDFESGNSGISGNDIGMPKESEPSENVEKTPENAEFNSVENPGHPHSVATVATSATQSNTVYNIVDDVFQIYGHNLVHIDEFISRGLSEEDIDKLCEQGILHRNSPEFFTIMKNPGDESVQ